uniref:Copper chaperone n=1 Tax=Candidatus Kentrum sp. DK TaxID=2126562 RepID=A0A450RTG2_9GAMM|nr:MAG: copper chaperone [Candidatus Kentron sp. DK]VFJ45482.1 MAG: copper chaperone [Candidatus Kentron sp. DK]
MQYTIEVDNIKCHGCANTIRKKVLAAHDEVSEVAVDVAAGTVTVTATEDGTEEVEKTLHGLGYPRRGSSEGFDQLKTKATSFVSCAIGRMEK